MKLPRSNRNRDSLLESPSILKPKPYRFYSGCSFPLSQRLPFSIKLYEAAFSRVLALLKIGCPLAIRRLIISVVVDALNLQPLNPCSNHVVVEVNKASPPLADSYSSTSVIPVSVIRGIVAPLIHPHPNSVNRMLVKPVTYSLLSKLLSHFIGVATAGCGNPATKVLGHHCDNVSAVAATLPKRPCVILRVSSELDHAKASKRLTNQIRSAFKSFHYAQEYLWSVLNASMMIKGINRALQFAK
jgi:hypothetical protein